MEGCEKVRVGWGEDARNEVVMRTLWSRHVIKMGRSTQLQFWLELNMFRFDSNSQVVKILCYKPEDRVFETR
jgi:hypothetical protein